MSCAHLKVKSCRIIHAATFDIMLNAKTAPGRITVSVQINLGRQANKWKKDVHPYGVHPGTASLCFCLYDPTTKSWKQSPTPFSNFPAPKDQFIHIIRPPTLTQGKGLLIGPLYSPHAVLILVPLFHYHVTNTVSQRERLDLF